jgi:hypothetical protein
LIYLLKGFLLIQRFPTPTNFIPVNSAIKSEIIDEQRKLIEAQTGADLPGVDPKQLASQELSLSTSQVVDVKKKNAELENEIMVKILEKLAAI